MEQRIAPSVQIEAAIEAVLTAGLTDPDALSTLGRLGAPSLQEGGRIEAGWSPGERAALAGRRGGYRPGWCCGQGSPRWTIGSSAIFYHPAGFA